MASVSPVVLRFVTEEWKLEVPSPPHDALSVEARRAHLAAHPRSYLGVTRAPEDGAADDTVDVSVQETTSGAVGGNVDDSNGSIDPADRALLAGRRTLEQLLAADVFGPADGPTFYVYRLVDGDHHQSGLVCGVATGDYNDGTVRIHERINQTRADHLARHLQVVGAQSSPIAMAFRSAPVVTDIMHRTTGSGPPFLDIVDENGLTQQLWRVAEDQVDTIQAALAEHPLYLIDGHHRAAAASTDLRTSDGEDGDHRMLSVLFPYEELRNQAFHRVLTQLDAEELVAALTERFAVRSTDNPEVVVGRAPTELALAVPSGPEETGQILRWLLFDIPFDEPDTSALENIDPIRLGTHVVGPVLNTDESGADSRLSYRPGHADLQTLGELTL
ncbi:MAG: DUF1015 domain-containing protein, partial [Actinomycetota bacterium]